MATLTLNPTAVFQVLYKGIKPTRNPDWFKVECSITNDKEISIEDTLLVPSEHIASISALEPGKTYRFFMSVGIQGERKDPESGRTYQPRLQYNFIKIV